MKILAAKLKDKNLKVTPQRLAIYHMLCNTDIHPSAENIYKTLEPTNPTMSLATVYKTLYTLKKSNLIQELNIGEGSFRYDATIEKHPHIICTSCSIIIDLPIFESIGNYKECISKKTNFLIENEKFYFFGKCPKCQGISSTL